MATVYRAVVSPTKTEVLTTLLRARGRITHDRELIRLGSFRFDDPAGEVGIETHILRAGPTLLQIPLTYRGDPLHGADDLLVATMQHSALGRRWVYDACGDPVYAQALATTIRTGATEAATETHHADGRRETLPSTVRVVGSGTPGTPVPTIESVRHTRGSGTSRMSACGLELVVAHELATPLTGAGPTLTGTWAGSHGPHVLARIEHGGHR